MSGAVDVLALMDQFADCIYIPTSRGEVKEARMAVAELIEAAADMNLLAKGPAGGVSVADKRAIVARMDAALARISGGGQ